MNQILLMVWLVLFVLLLPVLLLWLAHRLSIKLHRPLAWMGPVIYVLVTTAFLLHDVLNSTAGPGLMDKWSFYVHSDASIGLFVYGISTTVCVVATAAYYVTRAVFKHRKKD